MMHKINAATFQRMVIHGAASLNAQKQPINDLNVFPVPDGDTGTNMGLTMAAAATADTPPSMNSLLFTLQPPCLTLNSSATSPCSISNSAGARKHHLKSVIVQKQPTFYKKRTTSKGCLPMSYHELPMSYPQVAVPTSYARPPPPEIFPHIILK